MKATAAFALFAICTAAHALPIIGVDHGFIKGTDCSKGTALERRAFVVGVIDGFYSKSSVER